jgi:2-oxoglutarate ferredoxin oxidoreductase subunit beta
MVNGIVESETKNKTNAIGLTRADYRGAASTLCPGCGHTSIAGQIIAACFELGIAPEKIVKFSGIGCSSKSPTYFLGRSFGFNGLHGRMPSLALGASFADTSLHGIGVSGDGDTASIGFGQFKHLVRRNLPMVYIVENNGVYGLTKGQFSATAEKGQSMKHQGTNPFFPVDICMEALATNATFVARSFAGDPKQVRELIKAALLHNGIAVLDIISPCVSFNNKNNFMHSYSWGREHEIPLNELSFVPTKDEIKLENFTEGSMREVTLHDGSVLMLKKLESGYDPTVRWQAFSMLEKAEKDRLMVTGLIYLDVETPNLFDFYDLPETPLNRLSPEQIRPSRESLDGVNQKLFSN